MRTPLVVASLLFALAGPAAADELTDLRRAFRDASGAELVFTRGDLPRGDWFEQMPELASADRVAAARRWQRSEGPGGAT